MMKEYIEQQNGSLFINGSSIPNNPSNRDYRIALSEVSSGESKIIPYSPPSNIEYWQAAIQKLYDQAMRQLQGNYSDEEFKTFAAKQDAIREYLANGLAGLSAPNRAMLEAITGSTADQVITDKLDVMVAKSAVFKQRLGEVERLRDEHLDMLVDGQDNQAVVDSLKSEYNNV